MKIIYKVEHSCGWGPYSASYFESYENAREFFFHYIAEAKRKDNYIEDSMGEPKEETDKVIYPKRKLIVYWKTESESNNENGHEFWEENEFLEILEEDLQP